MKKNIAIFLNRDFEIRDLKFIIQKLLANNFNVDVYYQKNTKDKQSFKYTGVDHIINDFLNFKNFKFERVKFTENSLLKVSRLIFQCNRILTEKK